MTLIRVLEFFFERRCRAARRSLVLERSQIELEKLRSFNGRTASA